MAFNFKCYFLKKHEWQAWEYEDPKSCQEVRICQRCREKEYRNGEHTWGEWEYYLPSKPEDFCQQKRSCIRCKREETRKLKHQWGEWTSPVSYQQTRICNCCGAKETQNLIDKLIEKCEWDQCIKIGSPAVEPLISA